MDQLTTVLGVLGAYFAIILVLAVSVETILEPFSWFKGLQKRVSPDDALRDIQLWLPENSDTGAKAAALANLSAEYKVNLADVQKRLETVKDIADETAKGLGVTKPVDEAEKKIAIYMASMREKYSLDERKRIAILRIVSAVVGIALAMMLKIDTFDILASLFPENVRNILTTPQAQFGGMAITGLASSAGSAFWHDQLGKLRAIKDAARKPE